MVWAFKMYNFFFKHVLSVIKPKKHSLYVFNGGKYKIIINDDC